MPWHSIQIDNLHHYENVHYTPTLKSKTVPFIPFSTSAADSALWIKSKSSVVGTSPWLSFITFALKVVGHFSKNLLAVVSPNISLKSCSICNVTHTDRSDEWCLMLHWIFWWCSELRCHTSPGVSRNRGKTKKTSDDLASSLTIACRYMKVISIFSRTVFSSAECLKTEIAASTSSSDGGRAEGLTGWRPRPGPPT